jgi:hypothetical protein
LKILSHRHLETKVRQPPRGMRMMTAGMGHHAHLLKWYVVLFKIILLLLVFVGFSMQRKGFPHTTIPSFISYWQLAALVILELAITFFIPIT